MARQYVAVMFKPGGRPYTFHHDGAALQEGDEVEVCVGKPNARGYRKKVKTKIAFLIKDPPAFATKPVLIPVDPDAALIEEATA